MLASHSRRHRLPFGSVGWWLVSGILGICAGSQAFAQNEDAAGVSEEANAVLRTAFQEEGESQESRMANVDLMIVAHAPAHLKPTTIGKFLNLANSKTPTCNFEKATVEAISRPGYQALAALFRDVGSTVGRGGGAQIQRNKENSQQWDIALDAFEDLEKIRITYKDTSNNDEVTIQEFEAKGAHDTDARLRYRQVGVWVFETEDTWEPVSYQLKLEKEDDFQAKQDWPILDRHFAIRLLGFEGSHRDLFETMADPEKMGTALMKDLRLPKPTTLMLADFKQLIPPSGGVWEENRFRVIASRLPATSFPERAWMLFPLTKPECKAAVQYLEDEDADEFDLSEQISQGKHNFKTVPSGSAGQMAQLGPDTEPAWYEIPPVYSMPRKPGDRPVEFNRVFEVIDIPGWCNMPEKLNLWRVIMYEYEDEAGNRLILRVENSAQKKVLWLDQAVQAWPTGLKKAIESGE